MLLKEIRYYIAFSDITSHEVILQFAIYKWEQSCNREAKVIYTKYYKKSNESCTFLFLVDRPVRAVLKMSAVSNFLGLFSTLNSFHVPENKYILFSTWDI